MCVPVEMMGVEVFCAPGAVMDWSVFFVLMLESWTGVFFVLLLEGAEWGVFCAPVEFVRVKSVCFVLVLNLWNRSFLCCRLKLWTT